MGHKRIKAKEKFVLLDLGNHFAVGKLVKATPHYVTLEVTETGHRFRPTYMRHSIARMVPISRPIAKYLGHFSYPYTQQHPNQLT